MHWRPAELDIAVIPERQKDARREEQIAKASVAEPMSQPLPRLATQCVSRLADVLLFSSTLGLRNTPSSGLPSAYTITAR